MMAAALVLAVLAALGAFRAYRVAARTVGRREQQLRDMAAQIAELALTRQACDAQEIKTRHAQAQAQGYRAEVTRLAIRNSELRDQLDIATGAVREPAAIEEFTAWLAELPTAEEQEYRRD